MAMNILGFFHGVDSAACLLQDGVLTAYVEEERLIRFKHAENIFPIRSIEACLKLGNIELTDVDFISYGWDLEGYSDGTIERFYESVNQKYPPDSGTLGWQKSNLSVFNQQSVAKRVRSQLGRYFGIASDLLPELRSYPHHKCHAAKAFWLSPLEESLVLVLDGSGDCECTTLWQGQGSDLTLLHEITIPHSLGWFYAAMTEMLGFRAYDGEYKVMGLAAYGRENLELRNKLRQVLTPGPQGWDYELPPRYIHHGKHTFSDRFTDELAEHLGLQPRLGPVPIESIHEDLAFETQRLLEETVVRFVTYWQQETGQTNLCVAGGVGLNVKLNSRIHKSGLFDRVWPFPIPNDSGTSIGSAVGVYHQETGKRPQTLEHVYLGPGYTDDQIETQIKACGYAYRACDDIADAAAELLADGKVVGWFQGRLEGGPRALGGRSILADPRSIEARDRVNSAIKFREYWRPFCPSMTEESADRFLQRAESAPYMILAFDATDDAKQNVPGVVHVDQTARVQTVSQVTNPRYYQLLKAFEKRTGVPVILNTSFNIKGEAIVCSPRDAFRTFWSTGIDALAVGRFLIEKPTSPQETAPEDVIR
ncbi:MAG: nodulation protein [Planctomycetaceae bacterium]|nr:nodulation protein [Planctomycetaceae bacterium]